ncbi:hypothetical protein, partial [Zymomonas mobilis]
LLIAINLIFSANLLSLTACKKEHVKKTWPDNTKCESLLNEDDINDCIMQQRSKITHQPNPREDSKSFINTDF